MPNTRIDILPIGEFHDPLGGGEVYVNTLREHLRLHHARVEKPHKHDFFAVMLFTSGRGTHTIDFTTYKINPGSIFLMAPGQIHSWDLSKDVKGFVLFHTRNFFDRHAIHDASSVFSFNRYPPTLDLSDETAGPVQGLIRRMMLENESSAFAKNRYIQVLIEQLYLELARDFLAGKNTGDANLNSYYARYLEFEHLLEENFLKIKNASTYADLMHMSAKHLNRIIQSVMGKSTSEVILERIVLEAQRMLIHSDKNFAEIAYDLGYDDYSYFSHIFKKKTGKSPSAFIKETSGSI